MTVTQISIFVENRPGRLAAVTRVLGEADVDIQALSIADTSEFGVLRLIVNATDLAAQVLRDAGFRVTLTKVLAVSVGNRPGGLAKALPTSSCGWMTTPRRRLCCARQVSQYWAPTTFFESGLH